MIASYLNFQKHKTVLSFLFTIVFTLVINSNNAFAQEVIKDTVGPAPRGKITKPFKPEKSGFGPAFLGVSYTY